MSTDNIATIRIVSANTLGAATAGATKAVVPALKIRRAFESADPFGLRWIAPRRESLPKALDLASRLPTLDAIRMAESELSEALAERITERSARLIVVMMLDALGKRASVDLESWVAALAMVMTDDDGIGDDLGLWSSMPIPPVAALLGAQRLVRSKTFDPRPAELVEAATAARLSLGKLADDLARAIVFRDAIDDVLIRFATDKQIALVAPELQSLDDYTGDQIPF